MNSLRALAICMTAVIAGWLGVVGAAAQPGEGDWRAEHFRSHPLVGTIWNADGEEVEPKALVAAARRADYLLLGEAHDNPDHHRLQAWLVRETAGGDKQPPVVFEMIPLGLQGALDAHLAGRPDDLSGLGKALKWEERGWPDWSIYRPVFEAAREAGLDLKAGNLDTADIRRIARDGPDDEESAVLDLAEPLPRELDAALGDEMQLAHCNLLPQQAIAPMVTVQRARDGALARALLQAQHGILIAGAGHVRKDWGVPRLIHRKRPDADIVAIAFLEASPELSDAAQYGVSDSGAPVFDYLVFTPRADLTDHCAGLAERFGKQDGNAAE